MSEEIVVKNSTPELKVTEKIEKEKHKVRDFFNENKSLFQTKRQASKYLMGKGNVYKKEHDIPMENQTRGGEELPRTPKSSKKKVRKVGKK